MGDLRSKAEELIEGYKFLYEQLKITGKLSELYPQLSGEWSRDKDRFIAIRQKEKSNVEKVKDIMVERPPHYTYGNKEVFDMMIDQFGPEEVKVYCKIAAYKYRMRAGYKQDIVQDINKALWYENKMKTL